MRFQRIAFVAGLFAVAVALVLALLQDRTNLVTRHPDGTTTRSLNNDPILTEWVDFIDVGCFAGVPCRVSGVQNVHGIYPRDGVPWFVALIAGIVVPYGLICTGGYLAIAHTSGMARMLLGSGLVLVSAILFFPFALVVYRVLRYGYVEAYAFNGVLLAVSVSGATAAAGAVWLFAVRPHKHFGGALKKT